MERTSSEPKARGAALWTAVGMMEELVPELCTVEFALTAAEEPDDDQPDWGMKVMVEEDADGM